MTSFLQPLVFYSAVLAVVFGMLVLSLGLLKVDVDPVTISKGFEASHSTQKTEDWTDNLAKNVKVDIKQLQNQIDQLGLLSDHETPSVTRILYTNTDVAGRRYVRSLMASAGLEVREDAIGNIFGSWKGKQPSLPYVLTGSHTDAIPHAGKYDGVLGVLGAIEAISALKKAGFVPKRTIEVLMFTSEEPTRFGYGCLGSRMIANQTGFADILSTLVDKNNISFSEAAASANYPGALEKLNSVVIPPGKLSAFVELHIEQGPILEAEGIPIGVVTAIAAPAALIVKMKGGGGHAGGLLMEYRNDAGLAGAELALAVERHVAATGSPDTVGTTGKMELYPGAVNSVPREAHLEIDVRDIDGERRDAVVKSIIESAKTIAKKRNVELEKVEVVNADPPALSEERVVRAVERSVQKLGFKSKRMVSRAYHDSLFMARVAPMGMIFIPCYKGYSHRTDEFASKVAMEDGVKVLALTLATLSKQ